MDSTLSGLAYLYVAANEESKKLVALLQKAQEEVEDLRTQIEEIRGKLDGGDTDTVPGSPDSG